MESSRIAAAKERAEQAKTLIVAAALISFDNGGLAPSQRSPSTGPGTS
jgi:hypothetical protein